MTVRMYVNFCEAYGKEFSVPVRERKFIFGRKKIEDLGYCRFEQIEECNRLLKSNDSWQVIADLVAVIYEVDPEQVNRSGIRDVYPVVVHIINELLRLNRMREAASEMDLKSEEIQAGAEEFQKYGVYMTVRNLAAKLNLKLDEVWQMPLYDAVLEIRVLRDEAVYNEKLHKLLTPKTKR